MNSEGIQEVWTQHLAACRREPLSLGGKIRAMGGNQRQFNWDESFLSNEAAA